jgi:hypothetical protein
MDLRMTTLKAVFIFAAQFFNIESMLKVICVTVVCKHVDSYKGYPNYIWDIISLANG